MKFKTDAAKKRAARARKPKKKARPQRLGALTREMIDIALWNKK